MYTDCRSISSPGDVFMSKMTIGSAKREFDRQKRTYPL